MAAPPETLAALRQRLARLSAAAAVPAAASFTLGLPAVDAALGGGLSRAVLHEVLAAGATDAAAAAGFAAALALRAAGAEGNILWVQQEALEGETGRLYAPGLAELGLDPGRLVLVRARDALGTLRAGLEGLRCPALGGVLIELWGEPPALDLTATRKLSLAAARSGVTAFLLRIAARERPGAAATRWAVATEASASLPTAAPGSPVFALTLMRHRAGIAARAWRLEWNRDRQSFQPVSAPAVPALPRPLAEPAAALSRIVVSLPARRAAAAPAAAPRRAG